MTTAFEKLDSEVRRREEIKRIQRMIETKACDGDPLTDENIKDLKEILERELKELN